MDLGQRRGWIRVGSQLDEHLLHSALIEQLVELGQRQRDAGQQRPICVDAADDQVGAQPRWAGHLDVLADVQVGGPRCVALEQDVAWPQVRERQGLGAEPVEVVHLPDGGGIDAGGRGLPRPRHVGSRPLDAGDGEDARHSRHGTRADGRD